MKNDENGGSGSILTIIYKPYINKIIIIKNENFNNPL